MSDVDRVYPLRLRIHFRCFPEDLLRFAARAFDLAGLEVELCNPIQRRYALFGAARVRGRSFEEGRPLGVVSSEIRGLELVHRKPIAQRCVTGFHRKHTLNPAFGQV
jgi:hypothetical protein